MKFSKKICKYEYLRAVCVIAVIIIHTVYSALLIFGEEKYWPYRSIMNECWWAVPVFLMITGTFMLDPHKQISYSKLYKKYVWRIVKSLLVFGWVYALMEIYFDTRTIGISQFLDAAVRVFTGETWAHMWYLYALIGLYIMLPIYRIFIAHASNRDLKYSIIVLFIFICCMPLLKFIGVSCGIEIPTTTVYPLYLIAGWMLSQKEIKIKPMVFIILLLVSSLALLGITVIRWTTFDTTWNVLTGYTSPLVAIQAFSLFGCFQEIKKEHSGLLHKVTLQLADKSFGIYLVHMLFINMFYKLMKINPFEILSGGGIALLVLINLICSYFIVAVMKKIPLIKGLV